MSERVCVKCGYDLMGSRPRGRCPECGNPYSADSGQGVRGSEAIEERTGFILRRARTVIIGLCALGSVSCGAGFSFAISQTQNMRPFVVSLIVAGLLSLAAVTSYLYERSE